MQPSNQPAVSARETSTVRAVSFSVPAGFAVQDHAHDTVHACWLVSGSAEERRAGGWEQCVPGTLRVSPAGSEHDIRYGPGGARMLILHVPAHAMGPVGKRLTQTTYQHEHGLGRLLERLVSDRAWDTDPLQRELDAFELFATAGRSERRRRREPTVPAWLVRVRDFLHASFERPLQLADIAAVGPSHPTHLAQAFRNHFGLPPGAYLRRLRLSAARHAITHSDRSLSSIAHECGFSDHAHMTRLFRAHLGVTPRALRG